MVKKGKKATKKNKFVEQKIDLLQNTWSLFQSECKEYECRMNSICNSACDAIRKAYADKFKKLPENVRNMTAAEYLNMLERNEKELEEKAKDVILEQKLLTEKKKTVKKVKRVERKRSCSVSELLSSKGSKPSLLLNTTRVLSETSLCTPLSKRSVAPMFSVTPKFNPRIPMDKAYFRKPKAGELVMSLSGSPLQNVIDNIPDKPCVSVSLGGGKVIQITEDSEISKLESDFAKQLDQETKSTLENLKQKLVKLL